MNRYIGLIFIFVLIYLAYCFGFDHGIGNQEATYGKTGLPKNCKAIVAANVEGYYDGTFTMSEALNSINRNCGRYGYSWKYR